MVITNYARTHARTQACMLARTHARTHACTHTETNAQFSFVAALSDNIP